MKKTYFRPEVTVVKMDAVELLTGSVLKMDGEKTIDNPEDVWTNKKNMWGKQDIWD